MGGVKLAVNHHAGAQLDLFDVLGAYRAAGDSISNEELYEQLTSQELLTRAELDAVSPIGESQELHSKSKRRIRWFQQTLKGMGLLERIDGERGVWRLSHKNKAGLHEALDGVHLVAYSTELGCAVWTNNQPLFKSLGEPIHLCVTSPPYPLRQQRGYGNVDERKWVDFIVESLEPVVKSLAPGGSVVLNVSNDIFEPKRPSRSLYVERMVLALHDELGLSLMDRWPWINLSKPPGPTYWASIERQQLNVGWEPVFWFTNNPELVRSDNRRVLEPHSEQHLKLLEQGNTRQANYGDGAYRLRGKNSYANKTAGKIPKNVIVRGHRCADTDAVRVAAERLGLPSHPAMFPTDIADFAIRFLTVEGDLVVDPFAGSNKVGLAAERLKRRWLSAELILEYVRVQAELFSSIPGFWLNPALSPIGRSSPA